MYGIFTYIWLILYGKLVGISTGPIFFWGDNQTSKTISKSWSLISPIETIWSYINRFTTTLRLFQHTFETHPEQPLPTGYFFRDSFHSWVPGGLPIGCALYGCVVTFLEPVDMENIPLFTRFHTSQVVVWDFWTINYVSTKFTTTKNIAPGPGNYINLCGPHMLSIAGRCFTFDMSAAPWARKLKHENRGKRWWFERMGGW